MSGANQQFTWTPDDVAAATGGNWVQSTGLEKIPAVGIDSRQIAAGALFVAIAGERHDGHDFIADALSNGAGAVMMAQDRLAQLQPAQGACIAVKDTTRALGDLAAYQRRKCAVKVAAITGSNGKTTTRRMTAAVIAAAHATLATSGNLNNHIGLPLTLFNLQPTHQWAVVEIGMNHFGEIRRLSRICRPDIGVIINIAPCHLEGVGDIQGVVKAKAEIVEGLNRDGVMVLNGDDEHLSHLAERLSCPVITCGVNEAATIRAADVHATARGIAFTLIAPDGHVPVNVATPGRFMVSNALAAAAVGWQAGMALPAIAAALNQFRPLKGRLRTIATPAGVTFVDDTYNANPGSVIAAIEMLRDADPTGRKYLVLGDMLELGPRSADLHHAVGERAAAAKFDALFATGALADHVAAGAAAGGMPVGRIVTAEKSALVEILKAQLQPGDHVLIKGSRGMAMETVLDALVAWAQTERTAAKAP